MVAVEAANSGRSLPPFKGAFPGESNHATARGRGLSLGALHSQMSSTMARMPKLKEVLRRRAAPNGLELSGPAKTRSDYRAELAGSAPASG